MYGICTYIWLIFMVNAGKYTIHGSFRYYMDALEKKLSVCFFLSGGSSKVVEPSARRSTKGRLPSF